MNVKVAETAGFCFGVQRAVDRVYELIGSDAAPIYTLGPIIHNEEVVSDLEKKGVAVICEKDLGSLKGGTVVIRSHGVGRRVYNTIKKYGLGYVDVTCPFVLKIHKIVERESSRGAHIVIIGDPDHPEVQGICGWCQGPYTVIRNAEDAEKFNISPEKEVCVVSQTTFNYNKFQELVEILRKKSYDNNVLNILNILNEKYGITEVDFTSSELELVPAMPCRSMGFDSSMVAGYGQDDKICVYASLTALMKIDNPKKTAVCIISDKEEIGSMGNTGMESHVFDTFIAEILNKMGINKPNLLDKVFCKSKMLSADVDAALDPIYASVSERNNASYLGKGVGLNKYTGARGKSGASDANAEFVAEIRHIFENNNVKYQVSELGKVDVGGGGTIAYILANKGVDVIDCGVPILSMHSPYEVSSKFDLYSAYQGYIAFWKN